MSHHKKILLVTLLLASTLLSYQDAENNDGGAFYINTGFFTLDMKPVQNLAESDKALRNYNINFSQNLYSMQGFGFYWGKKGSGRGGLSFGAGYKRYKSSSASLISRNSTGDTIRDTITGLPIMSDSALNIVVIPACGMFMFEKSATIGSINLFGGGAIGGGALVLVKSAEKASESTAFSNDPFAEMGNSGDNSKLEGNVAVAPLWMAELHAGATITLTRWLHAGIDGFVSYHFASEGFIGADQESFGQFTPGIRMRLVFGSLG